MEKHTKEYAEKLAEKYAEDENSCYNNDLNSFKNGYMKAIEETNVKELLDALILFTNSYKEAHDSGDWGNWDLDKDEPYVKAINAIKKATE